MKPGQDLVLAGWVGYEGTVRIWRQRRRELEARFPAGFLRCLEEPAGWSTEKWRQAHQRAQGGLFTAWESAEEGGIFAALWNFSGAFCVGIDVDLRRMPMRQVTTEICELYGLNPYRLRCGNCMLLAAEGGARLVRELEAAGIPAAVIGCAAPGIARQIRSGEEKDGYLERPQPDELRKLLGT